MKRTLSLAALPAILLTSAVEAAPEQCSVVVNLEARDPEAGLVPQPHVIDVGKGTLVRSLYDGAVAVAIDGKLHEYRVVRLTRKTSTPLNVSAKMSITVDEAWSELQHRLEGEPLFETVMGKPLGFEVDPNEPDQALDLDEDHRISVRGVFGTYLSGHTSSGGYGGGAHGFDDTTDWVFAAGPELKEVHVGSLLGDANVKAARAYAHDQYEKEQVSDDLPIKWLDLKGAVLQPTQTGLHLESDLFCCTWAENHNRFTVSVDLPERPEFLKGLVPDSDGWIDGGCGAVRVTQSGIETRGPDGAIKHVARVPAGSLLGVSWITGPEARGRDVPRADLTVLKRGARVMMKAGEYYDAVDLFTLAVTLTPDDPGLLGEQGWALFKVKRYTEARAVLEKALTLAKGGERIGALRFNLGRVAEEEGKAAEAVVHYKASLKARPGNAVVKKRLKGLKTRKK
ncbi:MAG: tetratricopeptide repeat protein [Bradymonadia bacterium]